MKREVAVLVKPGFRQGLWTTYAVSYELTEDGAVKGVWLHQQRKRARSTEDRHERYGPISIIEGD